MDMLVEITGSSQYWVLVLLRLGNNFKLSDFRIKEYALKKDKK